MDSGKDLEMMAETIDNSNTNKNEYENNQIIDRSENTIHFSTPEIFTIPDRDERVMQTIFWNRDVGVRFSRFHFISLLPVLMLTILTLQRDKSNAVDLSLLIGIGVETMYIVYFGVVGYLLWTGTQSSENRYLFRIWTRSEPVPGWANMNIAAHQQIYELQAIQSISEFSAIDGGIPSYMLSNLGPITWTIVTMHFAAELQYNEVFEWDATDIFEMIGVLGLTMIGIFELDPYNPTMQKFHYTGAVCGCGTIVGFVLQSYSLSKNDDWWWEFIFSLFILCTALTFCVLWQLSNRKTNQYQKEISEKYKSPESIPKDELVAIKTYITELSVRNVIYEGIFLFLGATSLSIWLMNYHRFEK